MTADPPDGQDAGGTSLQPTSEEILRLFEAHLPTPASLDELQRVQGVGPVLSMESMRADLWESDEEVDAFIAQVRAARDADLA